MHGLGNGLLQAVAGASSLGDIAHVATEMCWKQYNHLRSWLPG